MDAVQEQTKIAEEDCRRVQRALEQASRERDDVQRLLRTLIKHPSGTQVLLDAIQRREAPWDKLVEQELTNPNNDSMKVSDVLVPNVVGPRPRSSNSEASSTNRSISNGSTTCNFSSTSRHYEGIRDSPRRMSSNYSRSMEGVTSRDMKPDPARPRFSSQTTKNVLLPKARHIMDGAASRAKDFDYYRNSLKPTFHPSTPPNSKHNQFNGGAARLPSRGKVDSI